MLVANSEIPDQVWDDRVGDMVMDNTLLETLPHRRKEAWKWTDVRRELGDAKCFWVVAKFANQT